MRENRLSGLMSGVWKRSMGGRVRHRQPKGPATDGPSLRHRATPRLYRRIRRTESCPPLHQNILHQEVSIYPSDWAERRGVAGLVRLVRGGGPDGVLAEVDVPPPGPTPRSTAASTPAEAPPGRALLDDGLGNLAHADPLGASPTSPGTRRYEAFGTVRSESGATANVERGFAGLVPEGDTGLLYARARHYEPETGRFLQPEPMGLFQPNLYSYASNNPVVFSDPSGFAPQLNLSGPPDFLGFDQSIGPPQPPSFSSLPEFVGQFGVLTGVSEFFDARVSGFEAMRD